MMYRVRHETRIRYAAAIAQAQFTLRLRPIEWPGQLLHGQSLTLSPQPKEMRNTFGPYLCNTTHIAFDKPLDRLTIRSEFDVSVQTPADPGPGEPLHRVRQTALSSGDLSSWSPVPYLFSSRIAVLDSDIGAWVKELVVPDAPIVDAIRTVSHAIHEQFTYKPGVTDPKTVPVEAFRAREGVCQDFAHVMITALRMIGIPAAYASGYLRTVPPPGQARLVGADAMHAWVNVWCGPVAGWIGIDPTNDCMATTDHILVAMGRDYADVSPINGVFVGQSPQDMKVAVDVEPIDY